MKEQFYIVYGRDDAKESYPFSTLDEASGKAWELARDNPGNRFYVMSPIQLMLGKVVMTIDGEECV